jgi:formylglycine-generating enzyme required for sulfatase activity
MKDYVTSETSWSVDPGISGYIDSTGLFRAYPGTQGVEVVTGAYHNLTASGSVTVTENNVLPIELASIPAGSFRMGDENGLHGEKPEHDVWVQAFEIGRYEVTNRQYTDYLNEALSAGEIFVERTVVSARRGPFSLMVYMRLIGNPGFPDVYIEYEETGVETPRFSVRSGFENFPVVRLTWAGAASFCMFYGLRLPTEAEWEKACRGGVQADYGTSEGTIGHDLANYLGVGGTDIYEGPAPVGSFPPNPYGLYDMCGNVAEYVHDVYDAGYYSISPYLNPMGPGPQYASEIEPDDELCYRGGGWLFGESACRSAFRGKINLQIDTSEVPFFGFRVAKSVE